jgi:EcsC family protein
MTVTRDGAAAARELPPGLWDRLRLDPVRAPEHIALAAARTFGPQAARWADDKRARFAVRPAELAKMAKKRHATLARFEGAATGVGGIATVVPDLAALAWIQARLVFYIAAAYGYDPRDPMRPAELLVLHGLYADPATARRALDGIGSTLVQAYVGSRLQREEVLGLRLVKMIGLHSANRLAGRLIPVVAIAFNAIGNERRTRALADRAIRFYGG